MSLYSVVVPVYNSEHTLEELYHRLEKVFRETLKEDFELILVDDGSKDRSYEIMEKLRSRDHRVKIIQMARNFGQHPALLCGFAHVKGDFVAGRVAEDGAGYGRTPGCGCNYSQL